MTDTTFSSSGPETLRIDYVPRPGLLRLALVNTALWIVTLSVYRFWARTNVRRHIWSSVHINGQPLEYTGKGSELFKGALLVFAVLILPMGLIAAAVSAAYGPDHPATGGLQTLFFVVFSLLWGAAVFKARRYQLSRTSWRGIRGGLEGSAVTYSLTYFGSLLARAVSLGWTTPVMNVNLQEQIIGGMRFGDRKFRFRGRAGPLYPSYALCWFLTAIVFIGVVGLAVWLIASSDFSSNPLKMSHGPDSKATVDELAIFFGIGVLAVAALFYFLFYPVIWSIYSAREIAQFAQYTSFEGARFRVDATAGSLVALAVGNFLLLVLTLGIARPFVLQRTIRYLCDRMTIEGAVDVDAIRQSQQPLGTVGEGLADAFDVGGL